MPDITKKSISATELGGLLGVSPWVTPWMLFQRFANGIDIDKDQDSRMGWGTLMEPLVLSETARQLGLEVQASRDAQGIQPYVRRGLIGCTRDATIWSPNDGPGACEAKCVFDYSVWMQKWTSCKHGVPPEIEVQVQAQMYVGDGVTPYKWGLIPVFVCGDLKLDFRREPIPELWDKFEEVTAKFFEDVAAGNMPDPFGLAVELPLIKQLYPPVMKKVRDYREEEDAFKIAEDARMYGYHTEEASNNKAAADALKIRLQGLLMDNEELLLPHGIIVRQKPHGKGIRLTVYVPDNIPQGDVSFFAGTDLGG